MSKLLTEVIGTFFLVLIIALSVHSGSTLAPLAISLGLVALVYMGAAISGAQYNPAVTVGVLVRGKMKASEAVGYVLAQLVGAFAAAAICVHLNNGHRICPIPADNTNLLHAGLAEFLFTFLLALVVLNVATSKKTSGNQYFGLAIGLVIVAGAVSVGGISGGAFNPAVTVALCTVAGKMGHVAVYVGAQLLAGALAALVFRAQHAGEAD